MLYALIVILISGIGLLLYGWWDTNRFDVRRVEIEVDRLPKAFDGFTVLQISDLHNRTYGKDGMAMIHTMAGLSFDCIAITGDLLDRHLPKQRENGYTFARESAKLGPVYFVQGNHEWRIGDWPEIKVELTQRGVRVLENEKVTLTRDGVSIDMIGLSEKTSVREMQQLISPNTCSILLAHRPERISDYAQTGADLVLSGHAHGGQVRLFGQGLFSPDQGILPHYTSGVYPCKGTKLYVSRGAGNHSFLPPRIFNRPEIDLITVKTPSR